MFSWKVKLNVNLPLIHVLPQMFFFFINLWVFSTSKAVLQSKWRRNKNNRSRHQVLSSQRERACAGPAAAGLAESDEAASSASVSARVPGAEACIPPAHGTPRDAFKTTDARTAGVKTYSVSNKQPRLRTPPNSGKLTCKPVSLIIQAPGLGVSHLFSYINCLKLLDYKCSLQKYNWNRRQECKGV